MADRRIGQKVLVVDDERLISDTLTTILRMHGFEASAAYSGEAAVERVETFEPDILLSDVWMGEMDGIDAAVQVREMQPECRIVLLSGGLIEESTREVIDEFGFEYLRKPIHPEELVAHLRGRQVHDCCC